VSRAEVRGLKRLVYKLGLMAKEERAVMEREVKRSLVEIEAGSKENLTAMVYDQPETPGYKRTGKLMRDQTHQVDPDRLGGVAGGNTEYGPHVHFGYIAGGEAAAGGDSLTLLRRHVAGRPYLYNAFEKVRAKHPARVARALDALHRKVARR
jgi:hypothetical protein